MSFISEHNEKYKDFKPYHSSFLDQYERFPQAKIGMNVTIGFGTVIYPNVTIYDDVVIGDNCVIDAGAVIGAEGFSIHKEDGKWVQMKNVGGVFIGNNAKIGANTCIDRASLEGHYTTIGEDVKIDNLVHIAHNCIIGAGSIILPQVAIGGSCEIGENVWIGLGAIIREHIIIGESAYITMGSVVIENVSSCSKVGGYYATQFNRWKYFSRLVKNGAL